MSSTELRHNKKRSTAIVYELLLRKLSQTLIEGNKRSAARALGLVKRYFASNRPIGMELEVIDAMRNARGLSLDHASRIISEVKSVAARLDRPAIENEKSRLIGEINRSFGKELFSDFRLADYRALASMQVFVETCGKKATMNEGLHRAQIESAIVAYMTSKPVVETDEHDPDRNIVSYGLALEKFEKKHGKSLDKNQKRLLETYVAGLFSNDFRPFKTLVIEEQRRVYKNISEFQRSKECSTDDVLKTRITESAQRLRDMKPTSDESTVSDMMLFLDLSREIAGDVK